MIDFLLLAVFALVVWLVSTDGPWGAAITFVAVLLGGLIAMNFFEPVAAALASAVSLGGDWRYRWDIISFWVIFSLSVFGLRAIGEQLFPTYAELSAPVYQGGKWGFAGLTAYVFTAIVCTTLHMAPLPREFLGFTAESQNLFGIGVDRHWLGFTQYASEKPLNQLRADGMPTIFDGAVYPSNPTDGKTVQVWSSFPIRYGARRDQFASGAVAQSGPSISAPPPPIQTRGNRSPNAGTGGF